MNILFIGGAGFLGSNIIREISSAYYNIEVFVLEPLLANTSRLQGIDMTIIRGNLCDIDLLETIIKKHKIAKVVHLVSTMVPGCGYEDYKNEFENVIFPTIRLMQLCSHSGIPFIYFSSGGTVYGERKSTTPFVETDPKEPISYYGLSKQMIENSILFEHRVSNLQYLVLRPSNPYGHGQNINGKQGFIAVAIGKILSGEPIEVWGDGNSVRDYIYIDDLSKCVSKIICDGVINTTLNIGTGIGYSVNQIIDTLREVVRENFDVVYSTRRRNDVSNMILCNENLKKIINYEFTSLKDGISLFYQHIKNSI